MCASTKASLSALELYHLEASQKTEYTLQGRASGLDNEGPNDKRTRRVKNAGVFTKGVEAYRARLPAAAPASASVAAPAADNAVSLSRVLARARPLFKHEAEAGEWDSLTRLPQGGLVAHEGTEQVKSNKGIVKMLRHHVFEAVQAVSTDAELYSATVHLLSAAAQGKMSTVFMYGMTGSGKTYSMDALHRKLPLDLFALDSIKSSGTATVRFHAYELVGKRCFDLADGRADEAGEADGEAVAKTEVFLRVDSDGATNMQVCPLCRISACASGESSAVKITRFFFFAREETSQGVQEHEVSDAETLLGLLRAAVSRRETSATGANATSSRSHAVYTLLLPGGGRLTLIDLAGSEAAQESLFHTKVASSLNMLSVFQR